MFLREIFDLIGYSKIQQIILIKILFLTGSLGFIEPNSIRDMAQVIEINSEYLSSEIPETLLFEKYNKMISDKKAEKILEVARFSSKEKAYNWLNSTLQRKFAITNKERIEVDDKYKDLIGLQNLLDQFISARDIIPGSNYDGLIILSGIESPFKQRILYSKRLLKNNIVTSSNIYSTYSDREAFPYEEPLIEEILAKYLTEKNKKNINYNLKLVKKVFTEVAHKYLSQYIEDNNLVLPYEMKDIRSFFKYNPNLYDAKKLVDLLLQDPLLKGFDWPNEKLIVNHYIRDNFKDKIVTMIPVESRTINKKPDPIDNALSWLKHVGNNLPESIPNPKLLLIAAPSPARYILAAFRSILPKNFKVQIVSPKIVGKQNASIILSDIAEEVNISKDLILGHK